jgi:hypothetical protein
MSVRYIHDSRGEFAGFIVRDALFSTGCKWLGTVRGVEVFNRSGVYIGEIDEHARLVRDRTCRVARLAPRTPHPLPPVRPLPPRRRLFPPGLPPNHEDVFLRLRRELTDLVPVTRLEEIDTLAGAAIVADDGTFLGVLARSAGVTDSIADASGAYGDPASELSIFNPTGPYGSPDSTLSPYHPHSGTPPRLERDEQVLGVLSANVRLSDRVDPNEVVVWLSLL